MPTSSEKRAQLQKTHCNPREAGEIAAAAGVKTVALTHHLPYRDEAAIRDRTASEFDGEILVAEDGMEISVGSLKV